MDFMTNTKFCCNWSETTSRMLIWVRWNRSEWTQSWSANRIFVHFAKRRINRRDDVLFCFDCETWSAVNLSDSAWFESGVVHAVCFWERFDGNCWNWSPSIESRTDFFENRHSIQPSHLVGFHGGDVIQINRVLFRYDFSQILLLFSFIAEPNWKVADGFSLAYRNLASVLAACWVKQRQSLME